MSATAPPVPGKRYRFVVRSAEEAATRIREQLGETARVISVRQVGGEGLGRFLRAPKLEIIAEISVPRSVEEATGANLQSTPASVQAAAMPHRVSSMETPEQEEATPHRIWSMLERAGLRREFLACRNDRADWQILPTLPPHTALSRAAQLLRNAVPFAVMPLDRRAAFLGSPGAGATTALCKQLAADIFFRGRQACVMKLDSNGPNPTEGLAMFCEALGVPLLRSPAEIVEVSDETTVYFDLPGAVLSRAEIDRINGILRDLAIGSRVLVVNAAYDRDLIQQAYARATSFGGTHVVFTHLDELSRWGKIWEFVLDRELTPLFGGTGPNLAGDCERDLVDALVRRTLVVGALGADVRTV